MENSDVDEEEAIMTEGEVKAPYCLGADGTCLTCQEVATEQQVLVCYDCKNSFHTECDSVVPFGNKSFVSNYKKLKNNKNFLFMCDNCLTQRENVEASTLKDQISEVVKSVAQLTKEVRSLKQQEHTLKPAEKVKGKSKGNEKAQPLNAGSKKDVSETKSKPIKPKVTVCITSNEGKSVDVKKVKDIIVANGIQVSKASINQKTGDLFVDLPSEDNKDKLVPLINEQTLPGNKLVKVKQKSPTITIRDVLEYENTEDFMESVKSQNPEIKERIESGDECLVVFAKEQENTRPRTQYTKSQQKTHQIVLRVSEEIRDIIKRNGNKIFIGFLSHRVIDRFYVKSCAKCHKFGHYHADCTTDSICGFCLSNEHESKNCPVKKENDFENFKCVNCKEKGKEFQGHSSHWHKCPVHIEQQKKIRKSIPYYSKN